MQTCRSIANAAVALSRRAGTRVSLTAREAGVRASACIFCRDWTPRGAAPIFIKVKRILIPGSPVFDNLIMWWTVDQNPGWGLIAKTPTAPVFLFLFGGAGFQTPSLPLGIDHHRRKPQPARADAQFRKSELLHNRFINHHA